MRPICTVEGCETPFHARGLCASHYAAARKAGMATLPKPTASERFWMKVSKSASCWEWTATKTSDGYGQMRLDGSTQLAHRISYQLLVDTLPEGLVLDHLCRNPSCVNPGHLEPVTQRVNVLRGEGPSAKQARQTHCKRGHEFIPGNTLTNGRKRRCRTCYHAWRASQTRKENAA